MRRFVVTLALIIVLALALNVLLTFRMMGSWFIGLPLPVVLGRSLPPNPGGVGATVFWPPFLLADVGIYVGIAWFISRRDRNRKTVERQQHGSGESGAGSSPPDPTSEATARPTASEARRTRVRMFVAVGVFGLLAGAALLYPVVTFPRPPAPCHQEFGGTTVSPPILDGGADCDPPFLFDREGSKRFKPECSGQGVSSVPPTSAMSALPSASPSAPVAAPATKPNAGTKKPRADCDPPWEYDSHGGRRAKGWCDTWLLH